MPASEAQIRANRENAARSTGPKTDEGKERSRANALKHGLAGAGVVLAEADAAEVDRKAAAYARELNASDEIGRDLARQAALNMVRMDRAADQQTAALAERVRQVEAEFVAPEGATDEDAAKLRSEAVRIAMFDPSKEATLARKYEAAAVRGFFRAIKELRQHAKRADIAPAARAQFAAAQKSTEQLGSFLPAAKQPPAAPKSAVAPPSMPASPAPKPAPTTLKTVIPAWNPAFGGSVDVPITIGLAR